MKRTRLCVGAALLLVFLSLLLLLHRRAVLGEAIGGPAGTSSWKVTLVVKGKAKSQKGTLSVSLPPDFRQQHTLDERLPRDIQLDGNQRNAAAGRRELTWYRDKTNDAHFRLIYSFRCVLGLRHPTPAMKSNSKALDAPPADGEWLKPSDLIECLHEEISTTAQARTADGSAPLDQVRALFAYVEGLETEPTPGTQSALECLREAGGNSAGKSRLLAALCRSRGIPARVVTGLFLVGTQDQAVHHWTEAWVNGQWLPLCATHHHFGERKFPKNHLVLHIGDDEWVRGKHVQFAYGVSVENQGEPTGVDEPPSSWKSFWLRLSPYALGPAEQGLFRFLLLLPLATLIVCIFRMVIGLQTYGTFGPALLGLAFLDLKALPWGIAVFVGIVLIGWLLRRVLDRLRLLLVPREATLLTLIVIVLLTTLLILSHFGIFLTQYVALFPMIILTHMVERFWTLEAEDGTAAAFRTLGGTLLVTVSISLALSGHLVAATLFRYPELVGMVLAAQLLLGRYTGYRLSELYRFRDLMYPRPLIQGERA